MLVRPERETPLENLGCCGVNRGLTARQRPCGGGRRALSRRVLSSRWNVNYISLCGRAQREDSAYT